MLGKRDQKDMARQQENARWNGRERGSYSNIRFNRCHPKRNASQRTASLLFHTRFAVLGPSQINWRRKSSITIN